MNIVYSGRRPKKLPKEFGYDLNNKYWSELKRIIKEDIIHLKPESIYCGMALGFDSIVAETIIELKKENYNINFIACIPFKGHSNAWPKDSRDRYNYYLQYADDIIILSDQYTKACMFERNKYMIDNSDILIAFTDTFDGGTGHSIKLAKKKGMKIYVISPNKIIERLDNND